VETNPLNSELNPICHLLALLRSHHILHVSRIRFNLKLVRRVYFSSLLSTRITQRKPTCVSEQHTSFLSYKMLKPLILTPLMWRIWWAPDNASKWQMVFNSAFKGLSSTWAVYRSLRKCTEITPWPTSASAAHPWSCGWCCPNSTTQLEVLS